MTGNIKRENTPTEQNKEDNVLVLYRLKLVEEAVKEVGQTIRNSDNIKRADLIEFRDSILARFTDIRDDLQKQIDEKANASELATLSKGVKLVGTALVSVITACIIYYLTYGIKK